jgi:hypothetical protein
MNSNKLKWIGFILGIIIFSFMLYYIQDVTDFRYYQSRMSTKALWTMTIVGIGIFGFPSLIASILSLKRKFKWLYLFGGIYFTFGLGVIMDKTIGIEFIKATLFLVLPGLMLFFIPIIHKSILEEE